MKYTPVAGDYVQVTVRGYVGGVGLRNFNLFPSEAADSVDGSTHYNVIDNSATVEKLPPPETPPKPGYYFMLSSGSAARAGYRYLGGDYEVARVFFPAETEKFKTWQQVRDRYAASSWTLLIAQRGVKSV